MATITIKSVSDLNRVLETRIQGALKATQKVVQECIQESVTEYYKEKVFSNGTNIPVLYDRTYKLLNSVISTEIVRVGNTYTCKVGISDEYLNYSYPGSNYANNLPATGLDILTWNDENGSHGGTVDGDWKIWQQAMQSLSGESGILALLKLNLKKYGIDIK